MKIVILGFYDHHHADALVRTMKEFRMNVEELGEFVQQAEVLASFEVEEE